MSRTLRLQGSGASGLELLDHTLSAVLPQLRVRAFQKKLQNQACVGELHLWPRAAEK